LPSSAVIDGGLVRGFLGVQGFEVDGRRRFVRLFASSDVVKNNFCHTLI
jgi:hypothetical protein